MVTTSIQDDLRSFRRSWIHHTGMQLATLSVLAATFFVISFVVHVALNVERLLATWGDGVQVTAYIDDDVSDEDIERLRAQIKSLSAVEGMHFIPREVATVNFKSQMAAYAPNLLQDSDFENPFPASFRIRLRGGVKDEGGIARLEAFAKRIGEFDGIEDVSFGKSWVRMYSSFVSAVSASGLIFVLILLAGGTLVVGNSIRASIANRREEIEILELVGATASMIRRPYVVEGLCMGALASIFALSLAYACHIWQVSAFSNNIALGRIANGIAFFSPLQSLSILVAGSALGGLGAWLTVRHINDGWSASQRIDQSSGSVDA
jgi:cell division transport system permease protein